MILTFLQMSSFPGPSITCGGRNGCESGGDVEVVIDEEVFIRIDRRCTCDLLLDP
jgi:hypothetical protein